MTGTLTAVPLGGLRASKEPSVFSCVGLASCIGMAAMDPLSGAAGMIHVMFPEPFADPNPDRPAKFADLGVASLVGALQDLGADPASLVVAYAGAAQILRFGGSDELLNVGKRNAEAIESALRQHGLKIVAADTGGTEGRTLTFCSSTGDVRIRTITKGERVLCNLKR